MSGKNVADPIAPAAVALRAMAAIQSPMAKIAAMQSAIASAAPPGLFGAATPKPATLTTRGWHRPLSPGRGARALRLVAGVGRSGARVPARRPARRRRGRLNRPRDELDLSKDA